MFIISKIYNTINDIFMFWNNSVRLHCDRCNEDYYVTINLVSDNDDYHECEVDYNTYEGDDVALMV